MAIEEPLTGPMLLRLSCGDPETDHWSMDEPPGAILEGLASNAAIVGVRLEGTMVSGIADEPVWAPTVTMTGPVAAWIGIRNWSEVAVGLDTAAAMAPPPGLLSVT